MQKGVVSDFRKEKAVLDVDALQRAAEDSLQIKFFLEKSVAIFNRAG